MASPADTATTPGLDPSDMADYHSSTPHSDTKKALESDFNDVACEPCVIDNCDELSGYPLDKNCRKGFCKKHNAAARNVDRQCEEDGNKEWLNALKKDKVDAYNNLVKEFSEKVQATSQGKGKKLTRFNLASYCEETVQIKQNRMASQWEAMAFPRYCQFHMDLPPPDNLTLLECVLFAD